MIIRLPLSSDPIQTFTIQLGSVRYIFKVQWLDRANYWIMDVISDTTATILVAGIPIVLGCDMWQPFLLGNGSLMAWDESGSFTDAGPDDLGTRVNVYWFSTDEVASGFTS
jgi:hypothetical protein